MVLFFLACAQDSADTETWTGGVDVLVYENCATCHDGTGSAPYVFSSYEGVKAYAPMMADAMEARTMPPWPADPDCHRYQDERLLDDADIARFRAWVEADMPEGEGTGATWLPAEEAFTADVVATPAAAYTSTAVAEDEYRCFVLDTLTFDQEMFVTAVQIVPESPQAHHALLYAIDAQHGADVLAADGADGRLGYSCFGSPMPDTTGAPASGFGSSLASALPAQIGGWVPGAVPAVLAEDTSIRIPAGSVVVLQMHYSVAGGDPAPDQTKVNLRITDTPTSSLVTTRPLANLSLEVPAGEVVTTSATFPYYGDTTHPIRSVMAHMHMLGTEQRVSLSRAGEEHCLLDVPDWDFHWQQTYLLAEDDKATLAPGDSMTITCTYDNTAANQPVVNGVQQSPQDVTWGESTLDEMCLSYFSTVEPYSPPADPADGACVASADCVAACGDSPSLDCLFSCPQTTVACDTCVLQGGATCGLTSCASEFTEIKPCLTSCLSAAVMLGGNIGDCMKAECADGYAAAMACADEAMAAPDCDATWAECGVDW